MWRKGGTVLAALGLAAAVWYGGAIADEQAHGMHKAGMDHSGMNHSSAAGKAEMGEAPGHSHERCELHGGQVTMTKQHHFETVFAPEGISVYLYTENQEPALIDQVKATAEVKQKDGPGRLLPLAVEPLKKGEKAVYFCTMDPEVVRNEPGDCPKCGMKLVPQTRLFGKMDLTNVEPGAIKVTFHIKGLSGKEKEVTFTETFNGLAQAGAMEHKEGMEGHEGMQHPEGKGDSEHHMH